MEKLEKQVQKKSIEVLNVVFGVDATLENNEQNIIWADENSILVVGSMSGQVDGELIKEVYVTSTSALGELYVYTYLYNLEDVNPSLKQMSELLINNAPRLKALN